MTVRALTPSSRGDLHTLSQLCCDGLLRSFEARLAVRPRARRLRWRVTRKLARPRVVSHVAAIGAGATPGFGVRQAVVRLRTRQTLETFDIPGPGDRAKAEERQARGGSDAAAEADAWRKAAGGDADRGGARGKGAGDLKEEIKEEYLVVQKMMRDGREGEWMVWGTVKETDWRTVVFDGTDQGDKAATGRWV